jgi:hypothetical protein
LSPESDRRQYRLRLTAQGRGRSSAKRPHKLMFYSMVQLFYIMVHYVCVVNIKFIFWIR